MADIVVGDRLLQLDILRNVDEHRSRAAGGRHVKRLPHHAGDVADVGHQVMVLGDAAADLDDRRFLKGVRADDRRRHLPGDRQQGDAVQLGVGDRGDEVCRPRAAGGHADADLAGAAGVALGGESAALLVPGKDDADLAAEAGQRLVQRDARPARIGENRVHPMIDQRLHDDVRAAGQIRRRRVRRFFRMVRVFWLILHGKHLLPSPNPREGATRFGKHSRIRLPPGKFKRPAPLGAPEIATPPTSLYTDRHSSSCDPPTSGGNA